MVVEENSCSGENEWKQARNVVEVDVDSLAERALKILKSSSNEGVSDFQQVFIGIGGTPGSGYVSNGGGSLFLVFKRISSVKCDSNVIVRVCFHS